MKKKTKRIIIGSAILLVLGVGSGITYYVVNNGSGNNSGNQEDVIEDDTATSTDTIEDKTTDNATSENLSMGNNDVTTQDTAIENNTDISSTTEKPSTTQNTFTTEEQKNNSDNTENNSGVPDSTETPVPPTNNNSQTTQTTTEVVSEHSHTWIEQYKEVEHPAVTHQEKVCVQEAYDEEVYKKHWFCSECGLDFTLANFSEYDITIHCFDCQGGSSYYSRTVLDHTIHHEPVFETVIVTDTEAYTETILMGYICSECGAWK